MTTTLRRLGALEPTAASLTAAGVTPVYVLNKGHGMVSLLLFAGGLATATALILEHRGHRYASVTVLVMAALAGGTVAALKYYGEAHAAPAPVSQGSSG